MPDFTVRLVVQMRADKLSDIDDDAMVDALLQFPGAKQAWSNGVTEHRKIGRSTVEREIAIRWLEAYLRRHGAVRAGQVQSDAVDAGIARRTLRRASEDLGVVKNPPSGGSNVTWSLPKEIDVPAVAGDS
jgi:phage-related protein